ncbi:unnamed protein product, partial [marine sediment metagenome]
MNDGMAPVLDYKADRFFWTRNKIEELTKGNLNAQIVDIGCRECPITRELPNCTWVDIESYETI